MLICGGRCADITDCDPPDPGTRLGHVTADLGREFDGTVDADAIHRVVLTSYRHLAETATVRHYLPVLAARRARALLTTYRDQLRNP
ncbi:three-helix bundle dimerization domain-containing protein [Actinokineospora guangxiensis]|uniref:Three-helix bundle dimerization domain-containing protein n=1 Tax=Actinokineospora guangxiensis TaxID=1490288 RepID=A0ABW0EVM1_9PSEU